MTRRIILSLFLVVLLTSCNSGTSANKTPTNAAKDMTATPLPASETPVSTATSTTEPTATATPVPVVYGPDNFPAGIDPLTGLVVSDTTQLDRRPISIKVNFASRNTDRPTWGLSFADIVYEYYHNGGVSRFHAIFYGENSDEVGPVRSGRLLDDSLVQMYKSYFAYGGATAEIEKKFMSAAYANRLLLEGGTNVCPPGEESPFCRFEPKGVDILLSGSRQVSAYETAKGNDNTKQNLDGMLFEAATPDDGKSTNQIYTRYSYAIYSRWDYDASSGRYLRFQDSQNDENGAGEKYESFVDRTTDQQIAADNVVVLVAPDEYAQRPPNEIVDIHLTGEGQAYAFRDGQVYDVRWNRPSTDSVLYLTYSDGTRYPFKPGKTWIQIVNTNSTIKTADDGSWHFTYAILP
jgi:hypothetical protein